MGDKEFGVKFTKTGHGFKIEVSGDEEIVKAHHEMADAWGEFMSKAREVAKAHYHKHNHHHSHPAEHGCCDHEVKKENMEDTDNTDNTEIKQTIKQED